MQACIGGVMLMALPFGWISTLLATSFMIVYMSIDKPEIESGTVDFLSECGGGGGGGCLRTCVFSPTNLDHDDRTHTQGAVSVWKWKDDGHGIWDWDWEGHGQVKETTKWCLVDTACMFDLISANPLIKKWNDEHHRRPKKVLALAFDPNNEDLLYLQCLVALSCTTLVQER